MKTRSRSTQTLLLRLAMVAVFLLLPGPLLLAPLLLASAAQTEQRRPNVVLIRLRDTIQPMSQEYMTRGLRSAADQHADAVVIELDTPGGLLDTTREMVRSILASPVPVIIWVGPSGSRAASAGFFLLESADIAAMAPGTNCGAAHPVVEGAKLDDTMKQKLENDTTAFLRSYVTKRNRDSASAEAAILQSKSYTAEEALKLKLIDLTAPSIDGLLDSLDGRSITRFDGQTATLHTRNAAVSPVQQTVREEILDKLMDPNFALLILVIGALLVYLEFNTPGTIVPGALGTLLVLLALFALNLLPVRYTSALLLLAAFALMLLEVKFTSHGVLAAAGILCLIFGSLTLIAAPIPELRIHPATAIATGLGFGLITVFLVRMAVRARKNKVRTGADALLGETGVTMQPLALAGQVLVHGELWQAEAPEPLAAGEPVRVRGLRNLTLLVERIPDSTPGALSHHQP